MSLRYVTYGHRPDWLDADRFEALSVLLFDPRMERGSEEIGRRLRAIDAPAEEYDVLVLRGSDRGFGDLVARSDMLRSLAGGKPIAVLTGGWPEWGPAPRLEPVGDVELPAVLSARAFREPEVRAMIDSSHAVYREEGAHFRLPSSRVHAAAFIRLADALQDATDVRRVADWVLEYLDERSGLLADTGTLLGLLYAVRHEAMLRFGWDVPIATLNEYPLGDEAVPRLFERFESQARGRAVFLVSVNSTGGVRERVHAVDPDAVVVPLCETDPGRAGADHFALREVERWDAGECPRCRELQLLTVNEATYEVSARIKWSRERFDIALAERQAPFWTAVERMRAAKLHVVAGLAEGSGREDRHHPVAIDVAALLGDDWFRRESLSTLCRIPQPDAVLVPRHACTPELSRLAQEAFGLAPEQVIGVTLDPFSQELTHRLEDCARILVLDDVLITGRTLIRLRDHLYRVVQARGSDIEAWAFVLVSQPPAVERRRAVERRYYSAGGARYLSAFELLLPDWADCPWCRELELLQGALQQLSGQPRELAFERIRRLQPTAGLEPPLLLCNDDFDVQATIGSFVGQLGPAAAFAAASSVAQTMRQQFATDRYTNQARVFETELLFDAFFDPLLVAGMLRTFEPRDLHSPPHAELVAATIRDVAAEFPLPSLVEVAYAAREGKLPRDAVRDLLAARPDADVIELLRALVG